MTFPLTIVFMFLVFWRPQEWLFPWMYGWPVLQAITFISVMGLIFDLSENRIRFPKTPAVWLGVGLWFSTILSHVAHGYFQGIMDTIPVTFKLCFFLELLLVVINGVGRLRWMIFALVIGSTVMAINAVLQDVFGVGFAGSQPLRFFYEFRDRWVQQSQFFGIFADPNDLGQFLATSIPLAFALPKRLGFISVVVAIGFGWLFSAGIFATQSRGTLIGCVASISCMVFLSLPTKWMPYLGGLMLIGGLIACALGGGVLLDDSARERVIFWGHANTYFKSHFLFGGGYDMFFELSGTNRSPHNAYVCCYSELGIIGYWFWFNMSTVGIIGCWRTRRAFVRPRNPEQAYLKRVAGLAIAAHAGFMASSYFLSRAYVFPLFFLFGLLNAIPVIAARYLPEDHPPLINFHKDVLLTGTLVSMGSIIYIYITILLLNRAHGG